MKARARTTRRTEAPAAKPVAYSYIRFSTPQQNQGDSLRRQTELRNAWLARNGIELDTSLTLEDKGVSGYRGKHRDNPDRHALAAFVAIVEKGKIASGSYLIVENLDRLSREAAVPALSLLLNLIQSGVRVVQLLPAETIYDEKTNPMSLMMAIMELSRGHSEIAMKSERGGRAWEEKRRRAAEKGEVLTARGPAWLKLVDGIWKIDQQRAEAVRSIYRMAIAGHGLTSIAKKLNAEKIPGAGKAGHWPRSYVAKLLSNRAVVGEYQPYRGRGTEREPDGDPVRGYYPTVISEEEWYAARAGIAARRGKAGRPMKAHLNVFTGLLRDARDSSTLQVVDKGKKATGRVLRSYTSQQGVEGCRGVSFPFATFEAAVLSCLREIDPRDVLPSEDDGTDKAAVLAGRLAEVEAEIEQVKNRLSTRYSDAVADVLERHEDEREELVKQLATAREEAATPISAAWGECQTLLSALDSAPDPQEARVRLRSALRRITESVWCMFVARGTDRVAAVQILFAGGNRRNYVILHKRGKGNAASHTASTWQVRSLTDMVKAGVLDLRNREHVAQLEEALLTVDAERDPASPPEPKRKVRSAPASLE